MDRRLTWSEFERDYPEQYAAWVKDTIERSKDRDYVALRGDGSVDLTTDEGAHCEDYWIWDVSSWRQSQLHEIRGYVRR